MDEKYKSLNEKNKLYKKILNSLPSFFAYKNMDDVYEIVSKDANKLYEHKFDTLEGKSIDQIYTKKGARDVRELDKEVIEKGVPINTIFDAETENGIITMDSTRIPIYDDHGKIMGIVSMSRDIGELIKVTERLERVTAIQDVIIDISKSFVNLSAENFDKIVNDSLTKLGKSINADRAYIFEYNFSANTMNNTHEWCNEDIEPEIENLQGIPISYYLDGWVNNHRKKVTVFIPNLQEIDKESNIYKVLNPQGIKSLITIPIFIEDECAGYLGFDAIKEQHTWDGIIELFSIIPEMYASLITQNRTLIDLKKAQVQAQKASSTQSDFIAKVTHELRTPINGLTNSLYLIQASNLTDDQTQYTDIMEYSLEVLSSMVNNILDYSKIEKNKLIFKSSEINLENEIIKIIKVNKYLANSKGLGLHLNYDYSIPTIVSADIEKLRQILNNLIVNAIKYTNYGHVEIRVTVVQNNAPYYSVKFEIIDTGIGISEFDLTHIFDEFYQVGDSLNKTPQGTGLGLSITTEFLHFLKSDLIVTSKIRQGSNFSFDLTLFSHSDEIKQNFDKSALIIDLSEGEHSNILGFLKAHFARVHVCNVRNCRLAIRDNFDVAFVFTNSNQTYLDKFRKIENTLDKVGRRMKKVLLYDDVKSKEILLSSDTFDCIMEVPSSSEELVKKLTMCGNKQNIEKILEGIPKNKKQRILLVDDNNINRRVMGELLRGMYLDVTEAKDGFEAVELVKRETFNMIFMDIFMPGMDGYETSKKIRELDGVRGSIPIIAVTANDIEATKEKIVEYGMNGVLPKPLRKNDLEKLLNEYFSKIVNAVDQEDETLYIFDENGFELFYEEDFLRKEILDTFFQDKQKDLKNITAAFHSKDCEQIHKVLHYMKGSFSYLKATKMLKITQQILDLSQENKLNDVLLLEEPLLRNYDLLLKELYKYFDKL